MAAIGNPIDIIGDALADRYDKALDILCGVTEADAIMVILTPQMMTDAEGTAKVIAKYKNKKTIFPVFIGGRGVQTGRSELIKSGLTHFTFPKDVIDSLDYLARNSPKRKFSSGYHIFGHHGDLAVTAPDGKMMEFSGALSLLSEYGILVSGSFLKKKEDLENTLKSLGGAPYAMKAISKEAIHKTDAGAVRLNVSNLDEASWIWEELWQIIAAARPSHEAPAGEEGILVQKMEKGIEVIIGMKRDNTFGPTLVFGLGGIFVEAIKDTVLRIAPVSKEEALKMMQEIKGIKILQGIGSEKPVNFDLLADIIVNLSRLALEHPEVKEIDLNPVMATDTSATIVDARIMI